MCCHADDVNTSYASVRQKQRAEWIAFLPQPQFKVKTSTPHVAMRYSYLPGSDRCRSRPCMDFPVAYFFACLFCDCARPSITTGSYRDSSFCLLTTRRRWVAPTCRRSTNARSATASNPRCWRRLPSGVWCAGAWNGHMTPDRWAGGDSKASQRSTSAEPTT